MGQKIGDGIVDQVSETFVRAAFSVVVRDNYDMAFSLFDAAGRQLTQSKRSIPSFMGTLPRTLEAVLEKFPVERLSPGDTGRWVAPAFAEEEDIGLLLEQFDLVDRAEAAAIGARAA